MGTELWIGTLLSIPIGVGTGLAVPPIQRYLKIRGDAKAIGESESARQEYLRVLFFIEHPEMLTQYLVGVGTESAFAILMTLLFFSLGGALGIGLGFVSAIKLVSASVTRHIATVAGMGYLGGVWLILVETTFVYYISSLLRICRPAIITLRHVRYFNGYVRRVPPGIRDLGAEERLAGKIQMARAKLF